MNARSKTISAAEIDRLRNEAVAAWIKSFPIDERLTVFLESVAAEIGDDIRRSVTAAFKAACRYLEDAAKAGPVELASFHIGLDGHLTNEFPWIREPALGALRSYTGWYAWHEGYLRNPD